MYKKEVAVTKRANKYYQTMSHSCTYYILSWSVGYRHI